MIQIRVLFSFRDSVEEHVVKLKEFRDSLNVPSDLIPGRDP